MTGLPLTPLRELLVPVSRPEELVPIQHYRLLGAHWYAEGLYVKDTKFGSEIQANRLYRVEVGDFVYNRLFAWKGSFALAGADVNGCYVSNEFPCFQVREDRVDARYLHYYFSRESVWNDALGLSTGGTPTSRNRLKEERLLAMSMLLPPIQEQHRIVERLDLLFKKYAQVIQLRRESEAELEALCRSIFFSSHNASVQMADLVSLRQPDTRVERDQHYHFAGVYCFGKGVFKGQLKSGTEFAYDRLTKIHAGEFTYPKLMAWEGALGIVPEQCEGLFVSPEYPVFSVDMARVLPEVLDVYYRTPSIWPVLAEASTGTNVRRRRLHPSAFLSLRMPLPPMATQVEIRRVRNAYETVLAIRRSSDAEVKALLASELNHVFRHGLSREAEGQAAATRSRLGGKHDLEV